MSDGQRFPGGAFLPEGGSTPFLAVDARGRLIISPEGNLQATEAIVNDGDTVALGGSTVTLSVSGSALTGAALPATALVVKNGDAVTVGGSTYTFTVAGGAITGVAVT